MMCYLWWFQIPCNLHLWWFQIPCNLHYMTYCPC